MRGECRQIEIMMCILLATTKLCNLHQNQNHAATTTTTSQPVCPPKAIPTIHVHLIPTESKAE